MNSIDMTTLFAALNVLDGSVTVAICSADVLLWLNAVEGFFAKMTRRRLKNGVVI